MQVYLTNTFSIDKIMKKMNTILLHLVRPHTIQKNEAAAPAASFFAIKMLRCPGVIH